jgi:hypothetical protein
MTVIQEHTIGAHRIIMEADDVIRVNFGATPSEAEMRAMIDVQAELAAGQPVYLMLDLTRVETMSAGARRAVGEASMKMSYKAFVMYGASFQMRVIAKLLNSALALFQKSTIPEAFVEDYDAAHAWIAAHRQKLTAASA